MNGKRARREVVPPFSNPPSRKLSLLAAPIQSRVMQALFDLLAASQRPLLVVGGHALTAYSVVRQTIDVDCLVAADDINALAQILKGVVIAK